MKQCEFEGCQELIPRAAYCKKHRAKTWRARNLEYARAYRRTYYSEHQEYFAAAQRKYNADRYMPGNEAKWLKKTCATALIRARKLALPFDTKFLREMAPEQRCECCSRILDYTAKRTDASPSLDRVIPELGYVRGNVHILCWRCNALKSDGKPQEFADIVEYIRRTRNDARVANA
jgi:hypothetical protein